MRELKAHDSILLNGMNTSAVSAQTQTGLRHFEEADVSDFSDPAGLIDLAEYVHPVPHATVSLTNSPGCTPAAKPERNELESARLAAGARPMRTVRVDAWAAPASASWGRPRTAVRKVSSQRLRATSRASAARSTDWALPF